jgi:acyl dehydratase
LTSLQRVVTQGDFDRFARLSGDCNPIHVDPQFCLGTRFGRTLCHGMFLYALIAQAIRAHLPPSGRVLAQELKFPGPVYAGDALTLELERSDADDGRVEVRARVRCGDRVGCESLTRFDGDV